MITRLLMVHQCSGVTHKYFTGPSNKTPGHHLHPGEPYTIYQYMQPTLLDSQTNIFLKTLIYYHKLTSLACQKALDLFEMAASVVRYSIEDSSNICFWNINLPSQQATSWSSYALWHDIQCIFVKLWHFCLCPIKICSHSTFRGT